MEIILLLLPAVLIALIPLSFVLLAFLIGALCIRFGSKRLRMAKLAQRDFLNRRSMPMEARIKISSSARSKKDLDSWDFVYQKNRWLAEHSELMESASKAHRENSVLYAQISGELIPKLESTRKLPFPLRGTERRKVERALSKMSWVQSIELRCHANYTSPAGRVNLSDSEVYSFDLSKTGSASPVSSASVPLIFDDPKALQFPGVYVYSYPHFMEGKTVFPVKIGKSESSVHARVRQQIAQGGAAIPEDPIIICAIRLDQGAGTAEALLHASFRDRRTEGGGTEWFTISLKDLKDEFAARKYSSTWNKELSSERYLSIFK